MPHDTDGSLVTNADAIEVSGITLPGATPDGIAARLLNLDASRGVIATIIHIGPGAEIPAHFHRNGAEAHYVLEGDLVDAGRSLGPGTYLTHRAGIVHGPHGSVAGCKVLTIQGAGTGADGFDFHLAGSGADEPPAPAVAAAAAPKPATPPDMTERAKESDDRPETERLGPTDDNPTNPTTG